MKLNKETLDKVQNIEGFPIGKDEDIIRLSDPPYYTACPNPFINEFIEKNGKVYNEELDDYNIEPYTADVSEGKNDPLYNAHSYHTKVPYKAIMRYILHYTKPGEIIFDGFCGTGMTGVAAHMCGCPDEEFKIEIEKETKNVNWGVRRVVLNDLSPIATYIAYNYNKPVDINEYQRESEKILEEVEKECGWMYETNHTINGVVQQDITGNTIKGKINYSVWSDVFICPNCGNDITFWDVAVDKESGSVKDKFNCEKCGAILQKSVLERSIENIYDFALGKNIKKIKQVPVIINYSIGNKRYEKKVDEDDLKLVDKINSLEVPFWYPIQPIMFKGERWGDSWRAGYHYGVTHVHHFFTKRNLWALACYFTKISKTSNMNTHLFILTGILLRASLMHKWKKGQTTGTTSGTLYIPSLIYEFNIHKMIKERPRYIQGLLNAKQYFDKDNSIITNQSLTDVSNINSNSIDYIFTDPPFGDNLMYSELNFIWESWLKVFTNIKTEAIMNKAQSKALSEYQILMEKCFTEYYRVLKPGRWMTVEFHNSQNSVWNAIQEAILKSGFVVANVKTLDKKQGSFKQVNSTTAVKQDLIISAYKPKTAFVKRFLTEAGTEEGVWDFVREHLSKLPVVVENNGMIDIIPERQNYLLYDSMVAFHIQKGATIPMGAADFYLGLKQRFPERDGMYFLPGQVSIYDTKRMRQELNQQLSFLVLDEKTAIQWLHNELERPLKYADIYPKFVQELRQLKYEKMPELRDLLEENFLQDEYGKWYVPDINKQSDLEKLRDKKLLKEFDEYRNGKGKLKVFRTEAIRVGFKHCWKEKDYKTIVNIGGRLPQSVVQEDPSILMYYDNALTRIGD